MRRGPRLPASLLAGVLAAGALGAGPAAAGPEGGCSRWRVAPTPAIEDAGLQGVSGTSHTDVWAVGPLNPKGAPGPGVVLHWDGRSWSRVPVPEWPYAQLSDVAALSTDEAWAVGYSAIERTLALRWDGTRWRVVYTPAPGTTSRLYAVSAASPRDVWAVGTYFDEEGTHVLALHWDGESWRRVFAPDATSLANVFNDVEALSSDDAWAVGYQQVEGTADLQPLIEHWDGTAWSVVPSPSTPGDSDTLEGVSAASPDDVWAVGTMRVQTGGGPALIEHWDGTKWSLVPSPVGPGFGFNLLWDVSAIASDDAWAVGQYLDDQGLQQTLTEHWDGTRWRVVASPSPNDSANLVAVSPISAHDVWAVGGSNGPLNDLLIEHSFGCR